jgi:hypothetical protein
MVAGNQNWNTQAQGTDIDYPLIRSWTVDEAFFTAIDVTTASKVVVIAVGAISCSARTSIRGTGHPHPEPAVHRGRRARLKGRPVSPDQDDGP